VGSIAGGAVVNLFAPLTGLLGPGEVCDGNDEEAVRVVRNTSQGIVPGEEGSKEAKVTTGLDARGVWFTATVVKVANSEKEESQIKREEEREEGQSRSQGTDEEEEGENEPSHKVKAERVQERGHAERFEIRGDLEASGSEDDSEGEPESAVG